MIIYISVILLFLDIIYLKIFGYPLFSKIIKNITNDNIQFNILGLLSYVFIIYGLYYFIIKENKSYYDAFILGIVIYGTFDFTNIGIFKNYNIYTGIIDTLWGGLLLSLTTFLFYFLKNKNIF